MDIQLAIKN